MRRSQCRATKQVKIEVDDIDQFGEEGPIDEDLLKEKLPDLNLPSDHSYASKAKLALEVAKQATTSGVINTREREQRLQPRRHLHPN